MDVSIADVQDDAVIRPVLERDRTWAAYALCDLEPPYRAHARFIAAVDRGRGNRPGSDADAVVLLYALEGWTALTPCGDPEGISAIMADARDLPAAVFLSVRRVDLPAVETRYRVKRAWTMLRMVLGPGDLRPPPSVGAAIVRLTPADLPAIQQLYALWPDTVFAPSMLQPGVYYGAYGDGALVAVAGTHTVGRRARVATIGNVFTHPAYRRRGLAAATTGAVAAALLGAGMRTVVLNVADTNAPALAAYRRLGFTTYAPYWEGDATLR